MKIKLPQQNLTQPSAELAIQPSMDTCLSGVDVLLAGLCHSGDRLDKTLIGYRESQALLQEMLRVIDPD